MPITWADRMDYVLTRGLRQFGRLITYQRTGYTSFSIQAVPDIIPHLESVDRGKFYSVKLRLKDFDASPLTAFITVSFAGVPQNGGYIVLDGVTYTFRTTMNDTVPNEIAKGTNASECAHFLANAINLGAGAGTQYSSATQQHPTCSATVADSLSNVCRVDYRTPGTVGDGTIAQEGANYVTLSAKIFSGGSPLKGDTVVLDGLNYNVTDIGYDGEGEVQLRLDLRTSV